MGNCLVYDAPERPKAIYIQVCEGIDKLREIAIEMNKLAVQAGFKPVKGGFNLHVKIAEVKVVKDQSTLQAAVCRLLKVRVGDMPVRTVKLKKEDVLGGVITYETVHEVKATESTRFLPKNF
jgi:2'-5' RNA ligase